MKKLTYENIAHAKELNVYLEQGNRVLDALGYTDHSQKHTAKVAVTAGKILKKLGYDAHMVELVRIAGYMHDLGNSINRVDHAHAGALMAFHFLRDWAHRRKILLPSSRPSASTMNGAASPLTPCLPPLSWPTRATSAGTASATPCQKPSTSTTASIMPPCRRSSTSTRTRKSLP